MLTTRRRWVALALIAVLLTVGIYRYPNTTIAAGDVYTFDYQDFWKEYTLHGYPAGSRLPCNGFSESTCTWAWQPWYQHNTDIPTFWSEQWAGRTVSGYALMMYKGQNLNAGIYRVEPTQMCHTYRFTMNLRSGLEPQTPVSANAQMQIGIAPDGFVPGEIVLTATDLAKIVWSATVNPMYAYQNMSVETQALASTVAVYTRASSPSEGTPYFFWDEGSFSEVAQTSNLVDPTQPLPPATGGLSPLATPSATSAVITWQTSSDTLGQVLYREVPGAASTRPDPYRVYLPLLTGGSSGAWTASPVQNWTLYHSIQLTNLKPDTTYEYVVVSYGAQGGNCATLITDSSSPLSFITPATH